MRMQKSASHSETARAETRRLSTRLNSSIGAKKMMSKSLILPLRKLKAADYHSDIIHFKKPRY